jgi:drug/metabolite transporter (DMT)-like permease
MSLIRQQQMQEKGRFKSGFLLAIFGAVLYSTKAIFVKVIYAQTTVDSTTLLTLRMLFASPFYCYSVLRLRLNTTKVTDYQLLIKYEFIAGGLFYISALFDFIGLRYVSASIERLVLFIYPTLVLFFSALFYQTKITKIQWQALILTYIGILLAFVFEILQYNVQPTFTIGVFFVLLASITYAFFIICNGNAIRFIGVEQLTNHTMLWATLCITIHFLFTHKIIQLFEYEWITYVLILGMAFFSTVIPSYLMNIGIRNIGSSNAAIINSIGPVSTILQAWLILGEQISIAQLIGTSLVLIGVWLIGKK